MRTQKHNSNISKLLRGVFILSLWIFVGCAPLTNPTATVQKPQPTATSQIPTAFPPQKLRITNQSAYMIPDLKVRFPDEYVAFGDVQPGETTGYRDVSKGVYRYSGYTFKLDGREYEQVPYDYLGEKPKQGYAFTYVLNFDPIRKTDPIHKTGIEVIQLVEVRLDQ